MGLKDLWWTHGTLKFIVDLYSETIDVFLIVFVSARKPHPPLDGGWQAFLEVEYLAEFVCPGLKYIYYPI